MPFLRALVALTLLTLPAHAQDKPSDAMISEAEVAIRECLRLTPPDTARASCFTERMYACDDLLAERNPKGLTCMETEQLAWDRVLVTAIEGLLNYDQNFADYPDRYCIASDGDHLRTAQTSWSGFRAASCDYRKSMTLDGAQYRYLICHAEMTSERAMELNAEFEFREQFCDA